MKPPIFLLGSHKSGTSLLRSLLDGHEDLFVFPKETHFFQYANFWVDYKFRRNYPQKDFSVKDSFLKYIDDQNSDDDPFSDLNEFKGYDAESFLSFFESSDVSNLSDNKKLMERYWKALCYSLNHNKRDFEKRFVEKSVENAEFAGVIRYFFPESKFVHIVRNPYATITAIRKMKSKGGFPFLGPTVQSMTNSYYNLFKNSSYLDNYMIIKYEDLLLDTKSEMKRICNFLAIQYSEKLLKPTYSGELWRGNSTTGEKFGGVSQKPLSSWKSKITSIEIKYVNYLFSHVLNKFQYEYLENKKNDYNISCKENMKTYLKNRLFFYIN